MRIRDIGSIDTRYSRQDIFFFENDHFRHVLGFKFIEVNNDLTIEDVASTSDPRLRIYDSHGLGVGKIFIDQGDCKTCTCVVYDDWDID